MFHHIVWSFDGADTLSIYVDGVLDKNTTVVLSTDAVVPSVGQFVHSGGSIDVDRSGQFDLQLLRVIDRALTPVEIVQNYVKLRKGTLQPTRDAACWSGADCAEACINGICQSYSYFGDMCDDNSDCVFGDCNGDVCFCGTNLECPGTKVCIYGDCIDPVGPGGPCDEDAGENDVNDVLPVVCGAVTILYLPVRLCWKRWLWH